MNNTYIKQCDECGEPYNAKLPIRAHESKYCSNKCRWRHRKRTQRLRDKNKAYLSVILEICTHLNSTPSERKQWDLKDLLEYKSLPEVLQDIQKSCTKDVSEILDVLK
jgi:hypothetical protein